MRIDELRIDFSLLPYAATLALATHRGARPRPDQVAPLFGSRYFTSEFPAFAGSLATELRTSFLAANVRVDVSRSKAIFRHQATNSFEYRRRFFCNYRVSLILRFLDSSLDFSSVATLPLVITIAALCHIRRKSYILLAVPLET